MAWNLNERMGGLFGRGVPGCGCPSRRRLIASGIGAGAATFLAAAAGPAAAQGRPDTDPLAALRQSERDPKRRVLLKGGAVLSMDGAVGNFASGDIMIEGKKIVAIGPNLASPGNDSSIVSVDAHGMIVMPGFVDPHRHSWEAQLRAVIPDVLIGDYLAATHRGFGPFYRPHDMYVGNLLTALGALDAGITCIIDNCHNSRSAAHSDEAIRGLGDSGIRGVHASGAPTFGDWDKQWPGDLPRLKKRFFSSDDQLLTLRIYEIGLQRTNWDVARELDIWTSSEGFQPRNWADFAEWDKAGLVNDRHCFNHMYGEIPEGAWDIVKARGIKVNVCARSDTQYGLGTGLSGLQPTLDHGIRPGLSVDNESSYGTDMFTEMRVAYHLQRGLAWNRKIRGDANPPKMLDVHDMLEFATVRGAECAGLAGKIGTLTPGKEADLIMVRSTDINTMPLTNAVATVVQHANAGNVDAVFVAGDVRKWQGRLVLDAFGSDLGKVRALVEESRDYLFEKRGVKVEPV